MSSETATPIAFVAGQPAAADAPDDRRALFAALEPRWAIREWAFEAADRLGPVGAWSADRRLRASGAELVHVDVPDAAPAFMAAARWLGIPCVVRAGAAGIRRGPARWAAMLADGVVFDSRAARAAAGWHTGWVLLRGVEPPAPMDRGEARRNLGALADEVVLAHLGPLEPMLGCDLVIEAAAALRHGGLPVRLAFIGDDSGWEGRYRSVLSSLAVGVGLAERMTLAAAHPQGAKLLAGVDVLVSAARPGSDPRGVPVALAAGVPVVATRVGAVPEWARDGHEGLLVPAEDLGALVQALRRLVEDAALRRTTGEQAARRARAEFSWEVCARRLSDLYDTVRAPYLRGGERRVPMQPHRAAR